ncbi:HNH endonuclease signature motif containing protein [Acinetobacter schindleri]|uniref:HNH endonuclease n=1 Tax=Acinetobacter schindleri TaxID=108981 RepID=UPI0005528CED|nr:HNH endonuclease signature motif containing protein [Acinetobacter schindleri]
MKPNKQQRAALKMKFGGHCAYCGVLLGDKFHLDHIESVQRDLAWSKNGGLTTTNTMARPHLDTLENLNPACAPCNLNKGSMPLEAWREQIKCYENSLVQYHNIFNHALRFGLVEFTNRPVIFFFETYKPGSQDPGTTA